MSGHSPGTWRNDPPNELLVVAGDVEICEMCVTEDDEYTGASHHSFNAALIAAAGTAANKVECLGYDGQAAIEALPRLIPALARILMAQTGHGHDCTCHYCEAGDVLNQAKGEKA